jgi:two-component system, cell cycle sensor histidine kinase and response regulator CckA
VKQSHGVVWVYSAPGPGPTFKMLFPAADNASAAESAVILQNDLGGSGTILVAEDEPGVRDFIRKTLAKHGYTVLAAPNGREALALSGQQPKPINLLVADVSMPEMGGLELAEKFAAEHPTVPVLFISGYADRFGEEHPAAKYLQKPFTSTTLLTRVRSLLLRQEVA